MTADQTELLEHVLINIRHAATLLHNNLVDYREEARDVLLLAQGRLEGLLLNTDEVCCGSD